MKKQVGQLTKVKKTPKLERVSSRIRLEAHKINLTPTSGRSPDHKSNLTEESNTEAENTADEEEAVSIKEEKQENHDGI